MVQACVAQLRALSTSIERFNKAIQTVFRQHPDRQIFENLPGVGEVLAPRLLADFGSDLAVTKMPPRFSASPGLLP